MMQLLRDESDWRRLTAAVPETLPDPPTGYPCLVGLLLVGQACYGCYVYPEGARRLLAATEGPAEPSPSGAAVRPLQPRLNHDRHVSALLMTMISELEAVGAIKRDRFEAEFTRWLAEVDQQYDAALDGLTGFAAEKLRSDDGPGR